VAGDQTPYRAAVSIAPRRGLKVKSISTSNCESMMADRSAGSKQAAASMMEGVIVRIGTCEKRHLVDLGRSAFECFIKRAVSI
jgi:hypothetical protein